MSIEKVFVKVCEREGAQRKEAYHNYRKERGRVRIGQWKIRLVSTFTG